MVVGTNAGEVSRQTQPEPDSRQAMREPYVLKVKIVSLSIARVAVIRLKSFLFIASTAT